MAHNFVEQLVAEWYEYQGYFVRRNVMAGRGNTTDYNFFCSLQFNAWHKHADTMRQSDCNASGVAGTVSPYLVRRGLLTWGAGTPAGATDLSATRTGRKDSRLSGPLDREATSAVAGLPVVRRLV
jgi:hypothetical protein